MEYLVGSSVWVCDEKRPQFALMKGKIIKQYPKIEGWMTDVQWYFVVQLENEYRVQCKREHFVVYEPEVEDD